MVFGNWKVVFGNWTVAFGNWEVVFGNWYSETGSGIRKLESGIRKLGVLFGNWKRYSETEIGIWKLIYWNWILIPPGEKLKLISYAPYWPEGVAVLIHHEDRFKVRSYSISFAKILNTTSSF